MAEKKNFEQTLKKLETVSEKLKSEDISLEDAIKAYEDGVLIGEGEHTRAVINVERFLAKLNK